MLTKHRVLIFGIALVLIGSLALGRTWRYYGQLLSGWDAQFYYAQSRAIALEGTLDITESLEATPFKIPFLDANGQFTRPPRKDGRIVNKYPIGLSLLEAPLLLLGKFLTTILGASTVYPAGYSSSTTTLVAFGLLFFTIFGLVVLHRFLEGFYTFWPAVLGVLAIWFGTSLFYYSAISPFAAHGAAFTIVVLILWQIQKLRDCPEPSWGRVVALGATFGMLFLVRPQQILFLAVAGPFLIKPLMRCKHPIVLTLLGAAVFGATCGIQILANYYQLGTFSANSYSAGNEGFDWLHPNFYTVLASASRGLLWMNPIIIIALAGVIFVRPRLWFEYVLLCHGLVQVYVIACWSSPEQGEAFGSRMWIECTPLVAVGVAKLFHAVKTHARWLVFALYGAALSWTTILMILYIRGFIESSSHADILSRLASLNFADH
jgi:hypothetical protein